MTSQTIGGRRSALGAFTVCASLLLCSASAFAQDRSTDAVYAAYMRLYGGEREGSFNDFKALYARDSQALPAWFGMLAAHERRIELDDSLGPAFEQGIARFLDHAEQRYRRSHADAESLFYLAQGYLLRSMYRLEHDKGVFGAARDGAKAKGYADAYIEAHPEHGDAYLALGLYNYYVDIAPNFIKVLRVVLFLPSGNRTEGLRQLDRASREGSLFGPVAAASLAEIYGSLEGRPTEAIAISEGLVQRFPGSAEMRLDLAQTYLHPAIEAYEKAAQQYTAVIDRANGPSTEHVQQRCQGMLGLANLRRTQWRLDEAIAILTPVIDQQVAKPAWVAPTFLLRRANYRALLNDPDAVADVRRVLAEKPPDAYRKAADRQLTFIETRRRTNEATIYAALVPGNRLVVEHRWDEARTDLRRRRGDAPGRLAGAVSARVSRIRTRQLRQRSQGIQRDRVGDRADPFMVKGRGNAQPGIHPRHRRPSQGCGHLLQDGRRQVRKRSGGRGGAGGPDFTVPPPRLTPPANRTSAHESRSPQPQISTISYALSWTQDGVLSRRHRQLFSGARKL